MISAKPFHAMFDKVDGFTRGYSETELLALSYSEKHNVILSRIRYLLSLKRSISYVVSHSYGKNKIPSNGDLPVGKKIYYEILFFSIWNFFQKHSRLTGQQGKMEAISLTTLYHFHRLHRHLDINWTITAESSPLHIASSRTQTWNLWFRSLCH